MTIIYRIQDKDGRGPFKPGMSKEWIIPRPDHKNLKTWMEDFKDKIVFPMPKNMACGCLIIDQLKRWFTKREYKKLKKLGYFAVSLEAQIIEQSDIQCLFYKTDPLNKNVRIFRLR